MDYLIAVPVDRINHTQKRKTMKVNVAGVNSRVVICLERLIIATLDERWSENSSGMLGRGTRIPLP